MKKNYPITKMILSTVAIFSLSCSENILKDFADKSTTEAKLAEINDLIDDRDFDNALLKFQALGASDQAERGNQVLLAKIYGGQCGLEFLQLSEDITEIGSNTLLATLMVAFPGAVAANVTACISAEATILGIDTNGGNRTVQENVLMSYVAWAKMGVILSLYADSDDDGNTDASFDPCLVGDLPQVEAQHIATGLANMLDGLGNIGGSSVGSDQLTAVTAICTLIDDELGPTYNFCNSKVIASVNNDQEQGIRAIVTEGQDIGIAADGCAGALGSSGACVCP